MTTAIVMLNCEVGQVNAIAEALVNLGGSLLKKPEDTFSAAPGKRIGGWARKREKC